MQGLISEIMMTSSVALLRITIELPTKDTVENTLEETKAMMTEKVKDIKTGGDQDKMAVIIEVITTTHRSSNIADTGSPSTSTSTDSLMIGGSTGVLDRADTTRNRTDTIQSTVRTVTENKNKTIPGTIRTMKGIIRPTHYLCSVR